MVSVNTTSNSFVLASLRQTNKDLATTQTRIGTGLKVNSASDNSAIWSTAQSIRSDIRFQEASTATISVSKAKADAAVAGLDKIADLLTKMQEVSDATSASATAGEVATAGKKIASYQAQITAVAKASGFQGSNFLTTAGTESVKIGDDAAAKLDFTSVDFTADTDFAAATGAVVATAANIVDVSGLAGAALTAVYSYQAEISAFSSGLESQIDFQTTLKTINQTALGSLVDANLEEESAKVTALQVKQQLSYQALAIGNSSSQNILALFQ